MARTKESTLSAKQVALWLVVLFALALALRVGFNVEPSYDAEGDRYLYSGNDPFYHDRTVTHILEEGESLVHDPAINYPHGGNNANPPAYDWTTAMLAGLLAPALGTAKAVSLALNTMVAVLGALTVFPVYMIGRELFSRKAGIWAAFLMAVSAQHIQRGLWGFADHDSATLLLITMAMAFLIKALSSIRMKEYVSDWRKDPAAGLRSAFSENRGALLWSTMAGLALAGTALVWKGYPYVLAVMGAGLFLQLLVDHVRNRDSSVLFAVYLIPLLLVILIPLPYYLQFPSFMANTIHASLYVLIAVLVIGLLLVPTRDLPSVLVFPSLVVLGLLGLAIAYFFLPAFWNAVFTGLGYFNQSKLYTTIGEAQRADLGRVAASFGFVTFLLSFWTFGRSVRRGFRGDAGHMLLVAWAAVAIFMAFAAQRFVSNSAPVFAVLGGAAAAEIASRIGWGDVKKRYRMAHGQGTVKSATSAMTWKHTLGVLLVVLALVLPNLWLGVDASMPFEYKSEHGLVGNDVDRFGAFGINYDLFENGWLEAMGALAMRDTCKSDAEKVCERGDPDFQPLAERPAFIAWWDYGHWAVNLGHHPTVADPFQNHFNLAGRFIASESEEEGVIWLTVLLLDGDHQNHNGYSAPVKQLMAEVGLPDERYGLGDQAYTTVEPVANEVGAFDLYERVMDATGTAVGYFAVDNRMFPGGSGGIFYAPVYLADKNPDEFIEQLCIGQREGGGVVTLRLERYGMDKNNRSYELSAAKWINQQDNKEWLAFRASQTTYQAVPASSPNSDPITCQVRITPTDRYDATMFAKAYGSQATQVPAGDGLSHWRLVHQSTTPNGAGRLVALLEYYRGVEVEGRVVSSDGSPVPGVNVAFQDGNGARHGSAVTDANGTFQVLAPFSVDDDLELVAWRGQATVANSSAYQFTRAQAAAGERVTGITLTAPAVAVEGYIYRDLDANTTYDETDETIAGATVFIAGRNVTTDAEGYYKVEGLVPGTYTAIVDKDGYADGNRQVALDQSNPTTWHNVSMTLAPVSVSVNLTFDGQPESGIPMTFVATQNRTATTNVTGIATAQLPPDTYTLRIDHTVTRDGNVYSYDVTREIDVPFAGEPMTVSIELNEGGRTSEPATQGPSGP